MDTAEGPWTPTARLALVGLALSALLGALGTSVANVGLPALAHAFHASFRAVQWVVLSYLLAITTLIVSAGRLGDLVGRRRLLMAGISLFTGASLVCGLTSTLWALIAARTVQGAGGAIMMALSMAMVGDAVPPAKTATAMGLLGTTSAVGTALGPSLGGVLLGLFGWRALFFLTVPLGLATLSVASRFLPNDTLRATGKREHFDARGTVLLALTLGTYALALTRPRDGFGAQNAVLLSVALVGALLFIRLQGRASTPLVRLVALRDRSLLASLGTNALVATVLMATLVVGPFYLSRALGLDPLQVGLAMSVGPLVAALVGVPAGRAADRFGTRTACLVGLLAMTVGTSCLALLPSRWGVSAYIGPMACLTAGYAVFQAANNAAVMKGVRASERGAISGLLNLSRNLGLVTGASLMGAAFAMGAEAAGPGATAADAAGLGMRVTFAVAFALVVIALLIAAGSRVRRLGAATMAALVTLASTAHGQASSRPAGASPSTRSPAGPYPLAAAGWGPSLGGGRFMSRWAEDWTGRRAAGAAPSVKAMPLGGSASLTLSGEMRVRHDDLVNGGLARGNGFDQTQFRATVGADVRLERHVRVYTEIATGQTDRLRRTATANVQNDASLQQLFVDARAYAGTTMVGAMLGRQEFADGPRQLMSVSDGPNVHRTWNGARLYVHARRLRVGAFDLRITRGASGSFDEVVDRGEQLRGMNASLIVARDAQGNVLFVDPFWMRTVSRARVGDRVGTDDRATVGARVWGQRGSLSVDWTLVRQRGLAVGRRVDAWGVFAVQSVTLAHAAWKPRVELRVDIASGGGAQGTGTVREFNSLYASSAYVGDAQFLGLRNMVMVSPGVTLSPTTRTRLALEYGMSYRFDPHSAVRAGGWRLYAETRGNAHAHIGGLLRTTATHAVGHYVSLFISHEYLRAGTALRRAGLPSGSFGQIGITLRY